MIYDLLRMIMMFSLFTKKKTRSLLSIVDKAMLMVHNSKKHYFVHVRLLELLKEYTEIHITSCMHTG